MSRKKVVPLGVAAALFLFSLLSSPPSSNAIRPFLVTEDAIPVEPNKSLLEGGLKFEQFGSENRLYTLGVDLRYGLITNLDFEVEFPYLFADLPNDRENSLGDLHLKGKVRFLKGREANPLSIAGMLDVKFPSASRDKGFGTGEADVGLIGIASKEFFPLTVHLNVGYTFVGNPPGQDYHNVFSYSLGTELQTVVTGLKVVGEVSGTNDRNPENYRENLDVLGGVLLGVTPELNIDLSVLFGLVKASPDYGFNGGFSLRF